METEIPEELKEAHAATRRSRFECDRLRKELMDAEERHLTLRLRSEGLWEEFHRQVRGQIEEVTDTRARPLAAEEGS